MNESKRLEELKRNFDSIYKKSFDKGALLEREIQGYSKILDESKLKLPVLSKDDEPLVKYDITYSSMEIFLIREFYTHFIVKGADVSDLEEKEQIDFSTWIRAHYDFADEALSEPSGPKYYYTLAIDLNEYLKWLKNHLETKIKYQDRYYAWYYGILLILGKEQKFPLNFTKKEIINFGKNRFGTGEGFYKIITKLDLTNSFSFLNSMTVKDKGKWKNALIDISNHDIDIINYLKKFPN